MATASAQPATAVIYLYLGSSREGTPIVWLLMRDLHAVAALWLPGRRWYTFGTSSGVVHGFLTGEVIHYNKRYCEAT